MTIEKKKEKKKRIKEKKATKENWKHRARGTRLFLIETIEQRIINQLPLIKTALSSMQQPRPAISRQLTHRATINNINQ